MKNEKDFSWTDISAGELAVFILSGIVLFGSMMIPAFIIMALVVIITRSIIVAILISPAICVAGLAYWSKDNKEKATWKDYIKLYMIILIVMLIIMFIVHHPEFHGYATCAFICVMFFAIWEYVIRSKCNKNDSKLEMAIKEKKESQDWLLQVHEEEREALAKTGVYHWGEKGKIYDEMKRKAGWM